MEIENAGIKSFAEIMAEKKRKRLLAQQESKKNVTPIVFEDRPGKIGGKSRISLKHFYYAPAIRRMRKGIKRCPCPSVRLSVRPCVRPCVPPFVHHLSGYFVSATPPTI